ncbi:hypothetical protein D3C81_1235890 [compost metagenome]
MLPEVRLHPLNDLLQLGKQWIFELSPQLQAAASFKKCFRIFEDGPIRLWFQRSAVEQTFGYRRRIPARFALRIAKRHFQRRLMPTAPSFRFAAEQRLCFSLQAQGRGKQFALQFTRNLIQPTAHGDGKVTFQRTVVLLQQRRVEKFGEQLQRLQPNALHDVEQQLGILLGPLPADIDLDKLGDRLFEGISAST